MLSAYRPGSPATPFEAYCINGLAYFLGQHHRMLTALFGQAVGAYGEPVALVEIQPRIADAGIADMVITFEGGQHALVEVQVESGPDESLLPALVQAGRSWSPPAGLVLLGLDGAARAEWTPVTWFEVIEALQDDPDPMARQFTSFILNDILGLGDVPLEAALATNRLYALGGAAVRRKFGNNARYLNSASRPMNGRYRYLGTTFSTGGDMSCWVGLVNESLPLSEHYHLMLATKETPLSEPADQPRATGDWKAWSHWTGLGRIVRPITAADYDQLLLRLRL